ncbi:MAG: hypothetical protein C0596_04615 [Marinilabiliales bacterium]|nr:MAG: hypothetical protein C0596_04615 [Marinilabiliales bacterium]
MSSVLKDLSEDYYILEIKKKKISAYKTLYYDSEDFICYYMHQFGRANRYKFRIREYVETGKSFFEIKVKNNHKKTYKSRIPNKNNKLEMTDDNVLFVTNKIGKSIVSFKGVLWVDYKRISLVSKNFSERLTIDLDLRFDNDMDSKSYSDMVILELKQDKSLRSKASEVLLSHRIFQESLSKYCL